MWTLNDGSRAQPALDPTKATNHDLQPPGFFASGNGAGNGSLTNVRSDRSFAAALDGRAVSIHKHSAVACDSWRVDFQVVSDRLLVIACDCL